jgi:hypothetical protein
VVIRAHQVGSYLPGIATSEKDPMSSYEIRVDGHLDDRWVAWFDGLDLTHEGDGTTTLRGPVVDQTALHGLLQRIRDLGLPLVSVTTIDALHPEGTSS